MQYFPTFRVNINRRKIIFAIKRIDMKKKSLLCLCAVMLLSGCSTSDSISGSISLSNVSHSECRNHYLSRTGFVDDYGTKLRLTYNETEETITGEYINYLLGCDYTDAGINIEQDADGTLVLNPWNDSEGAVDCVCHLNIYFTIRNASRQSYHLILNRQTVTIIDPDGSKHEEVWTDYDGNISFKNQNVITIDL